MYDAFLVSVLNGLANRLKQLKPFVGRTNAHARDILCA